MFDKMSPEAMSAWQRLEEMTGGGLKINSAYRSPEHNAKVGGAKNSQHIHGNAFDADVSGMPIPERVDLIRMAQDAGFRGIGVYDNALHFDVGPARYWGPDYTRNSTPEWALEALGGGSTDYGVGPTQARADAGVPLNTRTPPNALSGVDRLARTNALMSLMPERQNNLLDVRSFMNRPFT